ncbi:hypothetical protein TNIN_411661 [Trichonephila inaurata madagascariensis]|uniref:Uncharacterized protein n=1 Tax=Trichonephila inaurata madagascariensis TaxID=2747483 RepID=A0A8X6M9G6_9ARAC|nr:hypothetical protein TNIN_411661 [Trichonephila inaurata madagascariensis]
MRAQNFVVRNGSYMKDDTPGNSGCGGPPHTQLMRSFKGLGKQPVSKVCFAKDAEEKKGFMGDVEMDERHF